MIDIFTRVGFGIVLDDPPMLWDDDEQKFEDFTHWWGETQEGPAPFDEHVYREENIYFLTVPELPDFCHSWQDGIVSPIDPKELAAAVDGAIEGRSSKEVEAFIAFVERHFAHVTNRTPLGWHHVIQLST